MSQRRFRRIPGGVCWLGLHLVWCLKYRRRIVGGRVVVRCGELWEQIAAEHGWQIVAKDVMLDQVHLLVRVGPTDAPAAVLRSSTGRVARVLGEEFRYRRGLAQVLWSPWYVAASVGGVSESAVRGSVGHQWDMVAS
jgi:REP-associated tyrosine transposase